MASADADSAIVVSLGIAHSSQQSPSFLIQTQDQATGKLKGLMHFFIMGSSPLNYCYVGIFKPN